MNTISLIYGLLIKLFISERKLDLGILAFLNGSLYISFNKSNPLYPPKVNNESLNT